VASGCRRLVTRDVIGGHHAEPGLGEEYDRCREAAVLADLGQQGVRRPAKLATSFALDSLRNTLKGQLDLELHGGRSIEGVGARIAQRLLAMTAAIWHNRPPASP
jgi:hypothetical protein